MQSLLSGFNKHAKQPNGQLGQQADNAAANCKAMAKAIHIVCDFEQMKILHSSYEDVYEKFSVHSMTWPNLFRSTSKFDLLLAFDFRTNTTHTVSNLFIWKKNSILLLQTVVKNEHQFDPSDD